jgi:glycosyltransferase involved in cell wall biosynthesis
MRPLVIIPTYNERENLPVLAGRLLEIPELRVLVVDDASPDGTGAVADTIAAASGGRLSVMHRTGPRGLGLSYIDAMQRALEGDATHICQMDADLSHNPADVPRLVAATDSADLAIGSRYVPGGRIENWRKRRILLSAFANRYVRLITGMRIQDCTTGFRCWRREALERLPLNRITSDGYAFLVELAWEATVAGCTVVEVPITFVERRQGASKLSGRVVLESALLPWRLAARRRAG